jgi:hypothetical protein
LITFAVTVGQAVRPSDVAIFQPKLSTQNVNPIYLLPAFTVMSFLLMCSDDDVAHMKVP